MPGFSGAEPLVGEIVGLRTFRVDDSGYLLPLYSEHTWFDGANTAVCSPPTGGRGAGHQVPDAECECGFYAYGTLEAAQQNRQVRYVQAVVAGWGGVVAGTQGFRAAHARIVALWLHPEAPPWLRRRIAARYPSARLYADVGAMRAEHPLTVLPGYGAPPRRRVPARVASVVGALALLGLGLLPVEVLHGTGLLWAVWMAATVGAGLLTAWLAFGAHGAGHLAAAVVVSGVLAWLLAPLFGLSGWLLRVPLLRGLLVAGGGYLLTLRPHHFPVEKIRRERAFCGVRP